MKKTREQTRPIPYVEIISGKLLIIIFVYWRNDSTRRRIGAIHLWRPHGGVRLRWTMDACGRGEEVKTHVDVRTEN